MNQNQINALAAAIAQLFAAVIGGITNTATAAAVATAPKAVKVTVPAAAPQPSGEDLLGEEAPAPAPVAKVAKPAAPKAAPVAGLIDLTGLTGLVKARAIAHNNRVNAASGAVAAPAAAPAPVAAPKAVKAPKTVKPAPVAAPAAEVVIDAAAVKTVGLALLKKDKANGAKKLQEILTANGSTKLSDLPAENFAAVHAAISELLA